VILLLANLLHTSMAAKCFPPDETKRPHVLVKNGPTNLYERYESVVGCNEYVIAGGTSRTDSLNVESRTELAVITRMDVATGMNRWTRTYDVRNSATQS